MVRIKEELKIKNSLSQDWRIEFEIKSHDSDKAKELHEHINKKFYELSKELAKFDEKPELGGETPKHTTNLDKKKNDSNL